MLINEWDTEPNELVDGNKLILRGPLGALCGYVSVPKDHPLFGLDYSDCIDITGIADRPVDMDKTNVFDLLLGKVTETSATLGIVIQVHGGLTYSADHKPTDEPDGNWWFGFDCSHCDDLVPGLGTLALSNTGIYRNIKYVKAECDSLAKQLADLAHVKPTEAIEH